MKKFLGVILFAAICFVLFLIPSQMVSAITSTPIYRFYSPRTQEHFFTYNPAERDQLLNRGWGNYEGV
ncbi:MAG: glycosyhydrolase, partial [Lacticaseibacillus paracasei]|nr:glycosyhydrolase [Lacticaseibacillus paracasei]